MANPGQQKTVKPLNLVKEAPEIAATLSKMVSPRVRPISSDPKVNIENSLNQARLSDISQGISQRITDADNILQLFPDIELASQILVSSILSPKDMMGTELIMSAPDINLPSEVTTALINAIKSDIATQYKYEDKLPDVLKDMLFRTGSYVEAVIPESSIDQLINGQYNLSREDISGIDGWLKNTKTLGFLGARGKKHISLKSAMESVSQFGAVSQQKEVISYKVKEGNIDKIKPLDFGTGVENFIEVTDDFRLLKAPNLVSKARKKTVDYILQNVAKTPRTALESQAGKFTTYDLSSLLYRSPNVKQEVFTIVPTSEQTVRNNVCRPFLLKIPSEAVIPVYTPGDEKNHLGYFILIDFEGHPVTRHHHGGGDGTLNSGLSNQAGDMSSMLLNKATHNLKEITSADMTIDNIGEIYANIVEADLIERLKNGMYGDNVVVGKNHDVYRIMFARALANQYTRLLYIPREICSYFAFNYYDNGVGRSLLDDLRVMLSLRAIILFSRVMALTKNSIATTHVNMKFDPEDPDPMKTAETAMHEIVRMRHQYFPLGMSSPMDLVDWIQRAGLQFTFENHPGVPDTSFEFEQKNTQFTPPDDSLDELLRKQTYMGLGISPETIDNTFNSEFAINIVRDNILLSKRILVYGQKFSVLITEHIKKIIHNDPYLKQKLVKIIREQLNRIINFINAANTAPDESDTENLVESVYQLFIDKFVVSLPKPDVTTIETQNDAFTKYTEALDGALKSYLDPSIMPPAVAGALSEHIEEIRNIYKAYFSRKWMADNGFMTELAEITAADGQADATTNILEANRAHMDTLIKHAVEFLKSRTNITKAIDQDLKNLPEGTSFDTSSSSDDNSGGGGTDDFGLGGDDLDINLDGGDTTDSDTSGESTDDTAEDKSGGENVDDIEDTKDDDSNLTS